MVLLFISGHTAEGDFQDCSFGGQDIESCFSVLSELTSGGWQLISAKLSEPPDSSIWLPVEAFDGQSMKRPLELLQREWEEILCES
jgi:hypothetical protein